MLHLRLSPAATGVALILISSVFAPSNAIGAEFAFGPTMAGTADPNRELARLAFDIKELQVENDKRDFDIPVAESHRVTVILTRMSRDIAQLQSKYRNTTGKVPAQLLYGEVQQTLNKHEGNSKKLILSLKMTRFAAAGITHECENFCERSCGRNSIGDWVCFLTCRRHC